MQAIMKNTIKLAALSLALFTELAFGLTPVTVKGNGKFTGSSDLKNVANVL
jgi:hypothetical protein